MELKNKKYKFSEYKDRYENALKKIEDIPSKYIK